MWFLYVRFCMQTKHFLLIGFLGMFIGAIVFCFLSFKKRENKMQVRVRRGKGLGQGQWDCIKLGRALDEGSSRKFSTEVT